MTTHSDDRGDRADRLSRLDQLERELAAERERLNRADTDAMDVRTSDRHPDEAAGRGADAERASGHGGSVRTVDLPELEERVTESQREAWALGYQAGIADSQTRTGNPTQNPFHPLRGI